MTIPTLAPFPPAPQRHGDTPTEYVEKGDAFMSREETFPDDLNAWKDALVADFASLDFNGTSTTSLAIGTGSKVFTTQAGKSWQLGQWLIAASAANVANYMVGQITGYSGTSLTILVPSGATGGSGTKTDWSFALTPAPPTGFATLDSPTFTGAPKAPTQPPGDNSTNLSTTAYSDAAALAAIGIADAMVYKNDLDCSANPNYPAADRGWVYRVSVAGKIGGASGPNVEVGDILTCKTDSTASGNHATVGTSWNITQANIDGAVIGPASAVDGRLALFDGTSGKLIKDSGYLLSSLPLYASNNVRIVGFASATGTLGSGATTTSVSLTSLTGGIGTAALENDVVATIILAAGSAGDLNLAMTTSGTTEEVDIFSDDTHDTNLGVYLKKMGSVPDTTMQVNIPASNTHGYIVQVVVLRYVNTSVMMDAATTTATGIDTVLANPAANTPVTSGSLMMVVAGAVHVDGSQTFTAPYLSDFQTVGFSAAGFDVTLGVGFISNLIASYDPAAFGFTGTPTTSNSWASATLLFRRA